MEIDRTDMDAWARTQAEELGELQAEADANKGASATSKQMADAARHRTLTSRGDGRGLSHRQEMMQADLLLQAEPWRPARVAPSAESVAHGLPRLYHRAGSSSDASLAGTLTARRRLARARSRSDSMLGEDGEGDGGAGPSAAATAKLADVGGAAGGEDLQAGIQASGNSVMTLGRFVEGLGEGREGGEGSSAPEGRGRLPAGLASSAGLDAARLAEREAIIRGMSAHDLRRAPLAVAVPEVVRRAGVIRFRDVREFVPRASASDATLLAELQKHAVCVAGVWVQRSDVWARQEGDVPSLRGAGATAGVGGVGSLAEAVNGAGVHAGGKTAQTSAHRAKLRDYVLWRFHSAHSDIYAGLQRQRAAGAAPSSSAAGAAPQEGALPEAPPAALTIPALAAWTREPPHLLRGILKGIAEELPAGEFRGMSAIRSRARPEASAWHPTRLLNPAQAASFVQGRPPDTRQSKDRTVHVSKTDRAILRKRGILERAYRALDGDATALLPSGPGESQLTMEQAHRLRQKDRGLKALTRMSERVVAATPAARTAAEGGGSRQLPKEAARHAEARRWVVRFGGDFRFVAEHPGEGERADAYWERRGHELRAMEAREDEMLPGSQAGMEARLGLSVSRAGGERGLESRASASAGGGAGLLGAGEAGPAADASSSAAAAAPPLSPEKIARGKPGDDVAAAAAAPAAAGLGIVSMPEPVSSRKRSLSIGSTGSAFQRRSGAAAAGGGGAAAGGAGAGGAGGEAGASGARQAVFRFAETQLRALGVVAPGWLARFFALQHQGQRGDPTGDPKVRAALALSESDLMGLCREQLAAVGHEIPGADVFVEPRAAVCERGAARVTGEEVGLVWDAVVALMGEGKAAVQKRSVRAKAEEISAGRAGGGEGAVEFMDAAFTAVIRRFAVSRGSAWDFKTGEHKAEGGDSSDDDG